jgi:hypothetical protein
MSVRLYVLTEERNSQSMNLHRSFIFGFILQRIGIPSFGYHVTKIKPHINTCYSYINISPCPTIVNEKKFVRPDTKYVTEKEGQIMNTNIDNYQLHSIINLLLR